MKTIGLPVADVKQRGKNLAKTKKIRLTKKELRLLHYPPTEETWICARCEMVNAGSLNVCGWCKQVKGKRPKRLWPEYITACKKLGVEPGLSFVQIKKLIRGEL